MKQVVMRACQLRLKGKIHTLGTGQVVDYPGEHACLRPVDSGSIDFATVGEEELLQGHWKAGDILAAAEDIYGVTLKAGAKASVKQLTTAFLDARFRHVEKAKVN